MLPKVEPHRLTVQNIAERLKISRDTVYRWIESGELAAIDIGVDSRPRYRVSEEALATMLKARAALTARKRPPKAARGGRRLRQSRK